MEIADAEEDAYQESPDSTACDNYPPALEASVGTPGLGLALSYPTPDSNPLNMLMPASKRLKRLAEVTLGGNFPPSPLQTPRPGNGSADRSLNNCQSRQSLPKFQPMVEDAPDDTEHDDPENAFANDDNFGDLEMQSILDETLKFLQDTSTPETNFEDPAVTTEASFQNTDGSPENGLDPAAESPHRAHISSNSISLADPLSATSHEDVGKFDDDHSNSRKRKHDVASPEEYDGSTPSTPSHSSKALSDGAHAESAASYLSLPAEEDEENLDAQGHFSQPDSRLASPSYEHSTEAIDDSGTQGPDPLG
ncbi:hypothetical protein LTS12_028879, partial [Elasticomyces elasticus]